MTGKRSILTVEDDPAIRRGIVDALKFAGYEPMEAGDGPTGLDRAVHENFDLLLLDLVLPGDKDGFDILKAVRLVKPTMPVIILSARGEESDRVRGLKNGADDYVVKPFSVRELLARVEAVMRRTPERPLDLESLPLPHGHVEWERREAVLDDGRRIPLSEREVELLRYLAVNASRAVSREEILSHVWGLDPRGVSTRTIDMHIARLREKIEPTPEEPVVLITVRGKGYKWGMT